MICMAKALSGGFIPVGAVAMTSRVMDAVFNRMDRAVVHGSTFSKNNMAMAAGLSALKVIEEEKLVENAARVGGDLMAGMQQLADKYELFKSVRGKGMMIAMEFGSPKSLSLKAAWGMLETANKGLFSQMITIPLFKNHQILSQVAGHGMNVVKFLPPLVINDQDRAWILGALDEVIGDCHKVPGAIWDLGKTLTGHALKSKAG
jgi:ornithine--oxo-acid transaminase